MLVTPPVGLVIVAVDIRIVFQLVGTVSVVEDIGLDDCAGNIAVQLDIRVLTVLIDVVHVLV